MDAGAFTNPSGTLVPCKTPDGRDYLAFAPAPLPPAAEPTAITRVAKLLGEANHAVGQLDGVGYMLPDPDILVRPYIRREAVLSSRIEGTQASFADLVAFEAADARLDQGDAREVFNYVDAMSLGLRHVGQDGITEDLVRRLHRRLLSGVRGERFGTPGEFRTIQNHIGTSSLVTEASFVPPPAAEMRKGSMPSSRTSPRLQRRPPFSWKWPGRTTSSRPFTRSWTGTGAWAGC